MGLSLGLSMRLEKKLNSTLHNVICSIPLFELSLGNLNKAKKEIESMNDKELELLSVTTHGGSGARAFFDRKLTDFLREIDAYEIRNPDVRVVESEGLISFVYDCDVDFEEIKPTLIDTKSFIRDYRRMLKEIDWVGMTSKKIYDNVLEHQQRYLSTNDINKLNPLTQSELADKIGLSCSTISRLLNGKSIRSLDGHIMPLKSLVTSKLEIDRLRVYKIIGEIIKKGEYTSDERIPAMIYEITGGEDGGIRLARRTVSKYRSNIEGYISSRR